MCGLSIVETEGKTICGCILYGGSVAYRYRTCWARQVQQAGRRAGHGHGQKRGIEIDPALRMEMDEVSRIFDLYDRNGDGEYVSERVSVIG